MPLKQITSSKAHPGTQMKEGEFRFAMTGGKPGRLFHKFGGLLHEWTAGRYLSLSGGHMDKGKFIAVDQIKARGSDGLKLYDDGGSGIFVKDGGNVGIRTLTPSYAFSISDGTYEMGFTPGAVPIWYNKTGSTFRVQTDVDNTNTYLDIYGKGTGSAFLRMYNATATEYLETAIAGADAYITIQGPNPGQLFYQPGAQGDVSYFYYATSGKTNQVKIGGYRAGDALRHLEIGVGVDAADTASFDGVSNYYFDGNVGVGTATPGAKLDVADVVRFYSDTTPVWPTSGEGFELGWDADGKYNSSVGGSGVAIFQSYDRDATAWRDVRFRGSNIQFDAEGALAILILSNGNVGVGTDSPTYRLEVGTIGNDNPNDDKIAIGGLQNSATPVSLLRMYRRQDTGVAYAGGAAFLLSSYGDPLVDDETTRLDITLMDTRDTDLETASPVISLESGGNVGIGVADPHSALEVAGAISSATLTVTTSQTNLDVSGVNVVFINITANINLSGLTGGVDGQVIEFVYKGNYVNTVTFLDKEGDGDQDFYMHTEADETFDGGGITFSCDGSNWYDGGHGRHV